MGSAGPWGAGGTSLADIALHRALTATARDVAAPVVLAVAALNDAVRVRVVAAAAAHEVTAVTAVGCLVALPGAGSGKSTGWSECHRPQPPANFCSAWKVSWSPGES